MIGIRPLIAGSSLLLILAGLCALAFGGSKIPLTTISASIWAFDGQSYAHVVIWQQRLPQVVIAATVGGALAVSGAVLQGLMRNPLASPAILGISSGATLFTVIFGFMLQIPLVWQGPVACLGGFFGFASALALARLVGGAPDPRGLSLILSGALVSMLYGALAHAILLMDPTLRSAALGWVTGNINFAYAARLPVMAPLALLAVLILWFLARPITLLSLGRETASATGVHAKRMWWASAGLVTLASSAAVAICGPVGFVGLVVPHLVRPLVGADLRRAIPINALVGASLLILADVIARSAFAPRVLHTGVVMDLLGGVVFIWLVRRVYLRPRSGASSGTVSATVSGVRT